jgi:uncharacterized protein YraI
MSNRPFIRFTTVVTIAAFLFTALIASVDRPVQAQDQETLVPPLLETGPGPEPTPYVFNVVTTNNVNLRLTPSNHGVLIVTIPASTYLLAIGRNRTITWIFVTVADPEGNLWEGWVSVKYLTTRGSFPRLAIHTETVATDGAVLGTALLTTFIRGGPGTKYELLGQLDRGETIILDGRSGDWYRFSFEGSITKGWLFARHIQIIGNVADLPNVTWPPDDALFQGSGGETTP